MADHSDFALERQRNAISFALYFLKTIVFLSAGTVVALLALIGKSEFGINTPYGCLIRQIIPFVILSTLLAVSASYCGYWAELSAHNSNYEYDTRKKESLLKLESRFFFIGHLLALVSSFIYFSSVFYLSWEFFA